MQVYIVLLYCMDSIIILHEACLNLFILINNTNCSIS